MRSKDGGRTWGGKQTIAAIKDIDEREGCGVQLRDGTLIVAIYYNNLYKPDGSYIVNAKQHLSEPDKHYLGTYVITSGDNGHTWINPNYIGTKGMPFRNVNVEGPTDAPIEMPDGSILMGLIGYNRPGDEDNRSSYGVRPPIHDRPGGIRACFSSDNGETWDIRTEVQLRKDFLNWDIGYPESLEMPDSHVLIIYYYNLLNICFFGGTYWKP